MVDVPVLSIQGGLRVQRVRLVLEKVDGTAQEVVRGLREDAEVLEQLRRARGVAVRFLGSDYVSPVVATTLERGTLAAELEDGEAVDAKGVGLALLAGCLSLGLDAPLRAGRVFRSGIREEIGRRGMPGGGMVLEPIGSRDVPAVLGSDEPYRLFVHEAPGEVEEDEEPGSEGLGRSYALGRVVSTAGFTAMALEPRVLLSRAAGLEEGAGFCLLLLWSCGEMRDGASFPAGIGPALKTLRDKGRLTSARSITELVNDGFSDRYDEIGHSVANAFKRGIDPYSEDLLRKELAGAGIEEAEFPGMETWDWKALQTQGLRAWLAVKAPDTLERLWLALDVLSACRRKEDGGTVRHRGRWGAGAVAGAAAGTAVVGMLAWYGLLMLGGQGLAWTLCLVGVLVGLVTMQTTIRSDQTIGALAATWTVLAILAGTYLGDEHARTVRLEAFARGTYDRMAAMAPQICAAKTEQEVREAIAVMNCVYLTDEPDLSSVGDDQILVFATDTVPRYRGILEGNPTRGEFVRNTVSRRSWRSPMEILERSLNGWTLLWCVVGGGAAFVIASSPAGRFGGWQRFLRPITAGTWLRG